MWVAIFVKVLPFYQEFDQFQPEELTEVLQLLRAVHVPYLQKGLGQLPASFASLDASRPWICYWIIHSLALLDAPLPSTPSAEDVIFFLSCCQGPNGGYGGGPMQIPHLAPTYASVCALITVGNDTALSSIDRTKMYEFLLQLCIPPERGGGFCIHEGGEGDLRACYLAMAVAHMLCLDKKELMRRSNLVSYVKRCQTYEGGMGGEPGTEAHGGYTYCGLAALCLCDAAGAIDIQNLERWACQRQGSMEGGFNGRTNKLVDGCYSYWQGGLFPLLQTASRNLRPYESSKAASKNAPLPEVPQLPETLMFLTPAEQALSIHSAKAAWAQQISALAVQVGDAVDTALSEGESSRATSERARQARTLLDQAGEAQEAAEQSHINVIAASCGAAMLHQVLQPAAHALPVDPRDPPPTPIYNYESLQLWILRCCQVSKGGLRDKPGKPPDYYHTCYCLSGLSSAQHYSHVVVGPAENLLKKADPLCNVVEEKLICAHKYFNAVGKV
ncbi:hypothetical protein CEUSTIGMA_g365.t1 [Chlamydomonas eustigma]|uniref:Protein farnesyltransferase subunit beta n=1 Tax=Chlamydomonas eustigma TaxID=1157962 RepID=A0A250WQT1_9CHLO|nr:hypothetical protein CEUSTIGMA_g365.t1 [Chlamydomonas eustigma]|eukprot:GAX72910.1 hypothetical protein CEUSTIGMA_g365.t1 [Chlamydomonas eustigma]